MTDTSARQSDCLHSGWAQEKAAETYRKIQVVLSSRENWGVIYAKGYYKTGKIHKQQGDTAKAIEHYEKFLDLWKDADPGLPEVEDVKKRLANLQTEQENRTH